MGASRRKLIYEDVLEVMQLSELPGIAVYSAAVELVMGCELW